MNNLKKFICLIIFGINIFSIISCASSSVPSNPSPRIIVEIMDDINLIIPYTCSDSQAFGWTKVWLKDNIGGYIRHEDASIGFIRGNRPQPSGYGNWNVNYECDYEFTLNNSNATIKLSNIYTYSKQFYTEKEHIEYLDSYIKKICNDFKIFIQSK